MNSPRNPVETRRLQARERKASLLEAFFLQAYRALREPGDDRKAAQRAWACLERNGLRLAEADDLPVGLLTDCARMREGLRERGFSADEIRASELAADPRLEGRLVGPIRDARGVLFGFWARDPEDRAPLFLFRGAWRSRTPAIGLDAALGDADGDRRLVLVEELFDVLLLRSKRFFEAAAIGGPLYDLNLQRWELLCGHALGSVVLVVNRGAAGGREIERTLDHAFGAFRTVRPVELRVVPGEKLGKWKTVGELVRGEGIEAFRALLDRATVHGYTYKAFALLGRHRPGREWTEAAKWAAWEEAIRFYAGLEAEDGAALDAHFVPPIVAELGLAWGTSPSRSPVDAAPPPKPAGRVSPNGKRRDGICEFHRCSPYDCFCFD
jgi:hypothetical protein